MPERTVRDLPPQYRHIDDRPWETLRWPGQESKMMYHPSPEHPTEPNAGLVRYEPGSHHPRHRHDFAQVWYILEGEFKIGDKQYGPGTMVLHQDPHFEEPLSTETGGLMLFVQYQGPSTGGRPIYDGRFNMKARRPVEEESVDVRQCLAAQTSRRVGCAANPAQPPSLTTEMSGASSCFMPCTW